MKVYYDFRYEETHVHTATITVNVPDGMDDSVVRPKRWDGHRDYKEQLDCAVDDLDDTEVELREQDEAEESAPVDVDLRLAEGPSSPTLNKCESQPAQGQHSPDPGSKSAQRLTSDVQAVDRLP